MRLLPEWAPQEAIILAWPDANTDWKDWLNEVQTTYLDIIRAINQNDTPVILLVKPEEIGEVTSRLPPTARVLLVKSDYDDTWVRDYGFLTCQSDKGNVPVSFTFNGWGNKFDASRDNNVNAAYLSKLCTNSLVEVDTVVEGGALEIDAAGCLLSTRMCLENPERNADFSAEQYSALFLKYLGATQTHILNNGHLEGDDTDGHIDTLVRFTPHGDLVIQTAFNVPEDPHYGGLLTLKQECEELFPTAQIFELALPTIYNANNERLPASYANYLISNNCIFAPIYGEKEDKQNIECLEHAYPEFDIIAIDCRYLVEQFGSLHCISMQVPTNTLKQELHGVMSEGVTLYE